MKNEKYSIEYLIPIVMGLIFFGFVFNYHIVNPNYIAWLNHGDASQHYIGWAFFRKTPWSFPILGRSDYGMELASAIVYTDSNPLLAIIFKIFSPLLNEKFQYFGIWLLACVILQSIVLWKIVRLYTEKKYLLILSVAILMFNPAWINRIEHINLMCFFLFSYGIFLTLKQEANNRYQPYHWCFLLIISLTIHFYIFLMVFINWALLLVFSFKNDIKKRLTYTTINIASIIFIAWIVGYFTVLHGSSSVGFGYFRSNLLAPIVSEKWSYLINVNHFFDGEIYEGFNFFGSGIIALIAILSIKLIRQNIAVLNFIKRHKTLFSLCVIMWLISLSNVIGIGSTEFTIPLPDILLKIGGILRSSGRFFWPVTIIISLFFIVQAFRLEKAAAFGLLSFCLVLQIADTSKGWLAIHHQLAKTPIENDAVLNEYAPLWSAELGEYKNIRWVPFSNYSPQWSMISFMAEQYNQNTDAIYFSRFDEKKAAVLNQKTISELSSGTYATDTAYLMKDNMIDLINLRPGDKYYKYKNIYILAPAGKACSICESVEKNKISVLSFSEHNPSIMLLSTGWSTPEGWGVWTLGRESSIKLPLADRIDLLFSAYINDKHPELSIEWRCGNKLLLTQKMEQRQGNKATMSLAECKKDANNMITLDIQLLNPASPKDTAGGADDRILGIGLEKVYLYQ